MNNFSFKRVWTASKNNFKINRSIPVIIFILCAIFMFLSALLPISLAEDSFLPANVNPQRFESYLYQIDDAWHTVLSINGIQCAFAIVFAIGASFICAVSLTAPMRDKKGSDFYNALPITRTETLFANLLSSLLYFLISIVPCWYLSLVIAHLFTTVAPIELSSVLLSQTPLLLFVILFFICSLLTAFIAFTVAGSVISALVFFATLIGYPALTIAFSSYVSESVFHTYMGETFSHNWLSVVYSSPVLRYFFGFTRTYQIKSVDIIYFVVWALVSLAILLLLVKIRKNENLTQAVVFPKLRYPLQYLWTFFFTLFAAWFLYIITSSPLWFAIGAGIGLLMSFIVLNMIFERSTNNLFKKTSHLFITGGVFLAVTIVILADVFGIFKEPTPNFNAIYEFSISVDSRKIENGEEINTWEHIANYDNDGELTNTDKQNIQKICAWVTKNDNRNYDKDKETDTTYYVNINFWCKNDPSGWYYHARLINPDEEFFALLTPLSAKYRKTHNENIYPIEKEVTYEEVTTDDFHDITIKDIATESIGIIGGADGPTAIFVGE